MKTVDCWFSSNFTDISHIMPYDCVTNPWLYHKDWIPNSKMVTNHFNDSCLPSTQAKRFPSLQVWVRFRLLHMLIRDSTAGPRTLHWDDVMHFKMYFLGSMKVLQIYNLHGIKKRPCLQLKCAIKSITDVSFMMVVYGENVFCGVYTSGQWPQIGWMWLRHILVAFQKWEQVQTATIFLILCKMVWLTFFVLYKHFEYSQLQPAFPTVCLFCIYPGHKSS